MSGSTQIISALQLSTLLSTSRIVVVNCKLPNSTCALQLLTLFAPVYNEWNAACKAIAPVYDQLGLQLTRPGVVNFARVNAEQNRDIAESYSVTRWARSLQLFPAKS